MKTIKLYKPFDFNGEKITEIKMDLEALTAEDMIEAERMASPSVQMAMLKEYMKEYQILVAARAAKKPEGMFLKLKAKDFSRVTIAVQNFLVSEELVPEEPAKE